MKKFILTIIVFLFLAFVSPIFANVVPFSKTGIKYCGIGVINVPSNYTLYKQPSFDSEVLRDVNYEKIRKSSIVNSTSTTRVSYLAFIPSSNIALLAVDMDLGNNWYNVIINQVTGETAWIYSNEKNNFMTYKTLFYKYGKPYGVKIFNDLSEDNRNLYSKDSEDSQILAELLYPKYINFKVIRGNWMLVAVSDMSEHQKIGWFKWRNDDGTLNMFPSFSY